MEYPDKNNDAILITGPTASGKSALALEYARGSGGVVINSDSMQVYDTLQVVTARPSPEDMAGVAHALYGHVPASRSYSTGDWLREMERLLVQLKATRNTVHLGELGEKGWGGGVWRGWGQGSAR